MCRDRWVYGYVHDGAARGYRDLRKLDVLERDAALGVSLEFVCVRWD